MDNQGIECNWLRSVEPIVQKNGEALFMQRCTGTVFDNLIKLYKEVDQCSNELTLVHSMRLMCRPGCCSCCVDDLTVFEVEAENIKNHYSELLSEGKPHAEGACAFLDDNGGCRIYAHRPYVCRTQGLPLRWIEEIGEEDAVEMRDICPMNDTGDAIETLPAVCCWTIGPVEEKLALLQFELGEGNLLRVSLRTLFRREFCA